MKQKKIHNKILNWIKDAWLKAIVVFLIVAGGFYAYGNVSWPNDDPNPVTGVVGMFVGPSTEKFGQTPATIGYDKVNGLCEGAITLPDGKTETGSHICTPDELINSYNHANTFSPINNFYKNTIDTQILWTNNGPPGYTANANDCAGWKDSTSNYFGTAWDFKYSKGFLRSCGEPSKIRFACCK